MVSVNIDKLVTMTDEQLAAYMNVAAGLVGEFDNKTISVVGNPLVAFKLAVKIMNCDKNVIFVDGDCAKSVFLGKYKLGKDLSGVCEYITGEKEADDLFCKTNYDNLKIVFTGNVEEKQADFASEKFNKLIETYKEECDIVVVAAGSSAEVAKKCDGTVVIMDGAEYSEEAAKKAVDELMAKGCNCAGIILENC